MSNSAEAAVRSLKDIPAGEVAKEIPSDDPDADLHVDPDEIPEEAPPALEAPPLWRVAKCLLTLREQVNKKAPNRSKASDGTIGDPAHQSRASDHNPWVRDGAVGVVTAMDITHDPDKNCDADELASAIRESRDERVKYIIWNRQIANSSPQGNRPAWAWRPYTGKNGHTKHVHISAKSDKGHYDSTSEWEI
jgi:hypothetical protein